jgi:hypothetical protein
MAAIIDAINPAIPTASATLTESDLGADMSMPGPIDIPAIPDIPGIDIPAIAFGLPLDPGDADGSGIGIPGIPGIPGGIGGRSITTGAGCAGCGAPGAARSIHRTTVPSL